MRSKLTKSAIIIVLLSAIFLATSCGNDTRVKYPTYDENQAVILPENVGYALAYSYIAVIDLDTEKILTFHRTTIHKGEGVEDFAVGPDGNLYVPVHASYTAEEGVFPKVRVIDPSSGKVITDIEVAYSPRFIYVLPGGKAVVEHNGVPSGGSQFACSIIDMNTNKLVNTLYFDGIVSGAIAFPNGIYYLALFDFKRDTGVTRLVEFDPDTNTTVGDYITLEDTISMCEPFAMVTDSKLYGCKALPEEVKVERTDRPHTLAVYEFPSGNILKRVDIEDCPHSLLILGEKAYLTHNDGVCKDQRVKSISVINVKDDTVLKTIELPGLPRDIAYSEATGMIYIACVKGMICIFDPATDTLAGTITSEAIQARPDSWGFGRIKIAE
jgi:DNA-binding beta-propeller fold protein YncE